jgi:CheY-like chemotaxis protein
MAPAKILIVDDDPTTLVLVSGLVERAGFTPVGFRKSAQAMEYLSRTDGAGIRIIIADLTQGNMDGFNFLKEVKKKGQANEIPFLFLSAMHDTTMLINAYEHGAVDYFNKPIKKELFIAKIRAMAGAFEAQVQKAHTLISGRLSEKPLDEILGLCEHESLNGFLKITHPKNLSGLITFVKGMPEKIEITNSSAVVTHADAEALEQMQMWTEGEFVVRRGVIEN